MNTLEFLTLVLVIFAALSYIDDHNNKKKQHPPTKVNAISYKYHITEGKSYITSDSLSKQIIHQGT